MKTKLTNMLREKDRKERIDMQSQRELHEDLYTLKINCNGERTVGKGKEGINTEKNIMGLKQLKL